MSGDIASPTSVSSDGSTPPPTTPGESDEDSLLRQAKLLDEVSEARPLKKLQEELEAEEMAEEQTATSGVITGNVESGSTKSPSDAPAPATEQAVATHPKHRKPLLNAYDEELLRIAGVRLADPCYSWGFLRKQLLIESDPDRDTRFVLSGIRRARSVTLLEKPADGLRCRGERVLVTQKRRADSLAAHSPGSQESCIGGVIPRHIRPEE
jgi:hypothetical protein